MGCFVHGSGCQNPKGTIRNCPGPDTPKQDGRIRIRCEHCVTVRAMNEEMRTMNAALFQMSHQGTRTCLNKPRKTTDCPGPDSPAGTVSCPACDQDRRDTMAAAKAGDDKTFAHK